VITFYELSAGFLIFTLLLPIYFSVTGSGFEVPSGGDLFYLVLLSIVCTSFAFTISLKALKVLDPFTLNLSVNLEPIYSILLAILFFNETEMFNPAFLVGTTIILGSVVLHSWLKWRQKRFKAGLNNG
jgi:drug/metabolite transporter (DMT)-like permease